MPGIPLVARETSYSRGVDQMCRQDSQVHLSAEEERAAEESLCTYCKPVELYNILQRRAVRNPYFLQRCLGYKIQAKHKRRIQMTISVSGTINQGLQTQNLFPLYILLARLQSQASGAEYSAVYRYSRACVLTSLMGAEDDNQAQAKFVLPEMNKLEMEAKSGSLSILLFCYAGMGNTWFGIDTSKGNSGAYVFWGKIPLESLYYSWEKCPILSSGQRAEIKFAVDMCPCIVKSGAISEDKHISIQSHESQSLRQNIGVIVSVEEIGAKEKSPYNSYMCNEITSSSLSHIIRLRAGNVIFNYRYYNNKLQRTEVTEDFSCPFCLVKCASFKGLRFHLTTSHDLFSFEFWVTEEYQAVNVSLRTDSWRSEIIADGVDPKLQTFFYCSKRIRRKRSMILVPNGKNVHPLVLQSDFPMGVCNFVDRADGVASATGQSFVDNECVQSLSANNLAPPAMLQFAKTRKLSMERSEPRNRLLLQKRQFFHSHRAQPMAMEQVMSDRDSEDEVDDDVADFEDRRMLDDFVDVTRNEKQMMHLWNSFVRKQRVLADGHIPWACEAFSRLHGHDLVEVPALVWCWRLFMIKLWNHGLLDARTMNNCSIILEQCQNQSTDQTKS